MENSSSTLSNSCDGLDHLSNRSFDDRHGVGFGALLAKETTMADSSGSGTGAASSSGSVFSHETDELIASNKVEGTAVYNRQGERVGTLHHFMVGKRSGQVAYAIMSFGGFMGLGEKHYPLPWNELTYDKTKGGYVIANPPQPMAG
jgi:PRC-barrel domain